MSIWIQHLIKAAIVIAVLEVVRRGNDRLGALLASLPWVTILIMTFMWIDKETGNDKIASHAWYTFWYVLPTMPMFFVMPKLLNNGWNYPATIAVGIAITLVCFILLAILLKRFEIHLW